MKYLLAISISIYLCILYNIERDIRAGVAVIAARNDRAAFVMDSLGVEIKQAYAWARLWQDQAAGVRDSVEQARKRKGRR